MSQHEQSMAAGRAPYDVAAEQATQQTASQASAEDPRTVEDLREELRGRDLPTSGTKAELLERLQADQEG